MDTTRAISIHALLAESDAKRFSALHNIFISIHALLAESDRCNQTIVRKTNDFYPRSPCGERRPRATVHTWRKVFLSTLSLRRATRVSQRNKFRHSHFYPRSPCGERRVHYDNYNLHCTISIHALLAESDNPKIRLSLTIMISIHALLAESDMILQPL